MSRWNQQLAVERRSPVRIASRQRLRMPLLLLVLLVLVLLPVLAAAALGAEESSAAKHEFFEKKIRPVLVRHCYECHSVKAGKSQGGLQLDSRQGIRRGGDSGPAVVPHEAESSLLIRALRQEGFEMPPDGKLPEAVIADFVRWIQEGAVDPRDSAGPAPNRPADVAAARPLWSLQPLRRELPPPVADAQWPRSPIDHFILARLEQAGLRPGPDADRATLARRVYFDTIGLPPTPEEITAFERDPSPDAYSRLVDRLLASPHFGERWGRYWLDVVRYADSTGGGRTRILHDAWRYRDYVLDAWNRDLPYDQFVAEQVAGDLMPGGTRDEQARRLTATGFLVLGPTNYELQDKELLRMEVVDEQIDTLGKAVLGMTIGCARCHDHKFDPIPTADYYALAGIFRSTKTLTPGNVSGFVQRPLPRSPEQEEAVRRYQQRVGPIREQLAEAERHLKQLQPEVEGRRDFSDPRSLPGLVVDQREAQLTGSWTGSSSVRPFVGDGYHHAPRGASQARFVARLAEAGRYEIRISHTANPNRASNVPVTVRHAEGETTRRVNQRQPGPIDGLFVSLGTFRLEAGEASVTIGCQDLDGLAIADAVQWLPLDGPPLAKSGPDAAAASPPAGDLPAGGASKAAEASDPREARRAELAAARQRVTDLQARLKTLEKGTPPEPPRVMSVQDEQEVGDYHVCIRGNLRNPGPEVPRGFLSAVGDSRPPEISPGQSGRLELAGWLAADDNPLTARVIANRLWQKLIGQGLVRTPDNFGTMGQPPTHPELLDYLALELMRHDWSLKHLVRQVLLSRVYRLASDDLPEATAVDPENRLLARAHHRRLDAESIRDLILSVSGQLDRTRGGSSIPASASSEFTFTFQEGRRSVYVPVFRNRLHELFEVFDFADPNIVSGQRNTSTLPTQALYLMNSPLVMQQARQTAQRLLRQADTDRQRVEYLYRLALGRPPRPDELQLTLDYLQPVTAESDSLTAWTSVCQALLASLDFRYLK